MDHRLTIFYKKAKEKMKNKIWDKYREPGYRYYHGIHTANLTKEIISNIPELQYLNEHMDIIIAAALSHDIKKMKKSHAKKGAKYINKFMKEKNIFSDEEQKIVTEIIENHNARNQAHQPNYVKVVQDSDVLSRYGVSHIYNEFYRSGVRKETREIIKHRISIMDEKYKQDYSILNYDYSKEKIQKDYKKIKLTYQQLLNEISFEI